MSTDIILPNVGSTTDYTRSFSSLSLNHDEFNSGPITIENIYVAGFTLVCFRSGKLFLTTNNEESIRCQAPGMLVLEKEQSINVQLEEVDGHLSFDILEIPCEILFEIYNLTEKYEELMPNNTVINNAKVIYTQDFPGRQEVFSSLKKCFFCNKRNTNFCGGDNCSGSNKMEVDSVFFLLSRFLKLPIGSRVIGRSINVSLKEKIYKLIYSNPGKQWKLADLSSVFYMSCSTIKRKLATEGTTFSDIYLSARMNFAAKLLRTGKHSVTSVGVECGYDNASYFIKCFKKHFSLTPSNFIASINH